MGFVQLRCSSVKKGSASLLGRKMSSPLSRIWLSLFIHATRQRDRDASRYRPMEEATFPF